MQLVSGASYSSINNTTEESDSCDNKLKKFASASDDSEGIVNPDSPTVSTNIVRKFRKNSSSFSKSFANEKSSRITG